MNCPTYPGPPQFSDPGSARLESAELAGRLESTQLRSGGRGLRLRVEVEASWCGARRARPREAPAFLLLPASRSSSTCVRQSFSGAPPCPVEREDWPASSSSAPRRRSPWRHAREDPPHVPVPALRRSWTVFQPLLLRKPGVISALENHRLGERRRYVHPSFLVHFEYHSPTSARLTSGIKTAAIGDGF